MFKISEATALAMHAVVFLAGRSEHSVTVREIASALGGSRDHLSKVLQRLTRAGFVTSVRGRGGGFRLGKPGGRIRLLDIYEAMEGPYRPSDCLFDKPVCGGNPCIMGPSLHLMNRQLFQWLSETRLPQLVGTFPGETENAQKDCQD